MAIQTALEKLQYNNEKNILIQGLPSSIEKQFIKLSFAKNVTPLLKSKKIDFALLFAVSIKQLTDILNEVRPAMQADAKLWIAHPKATAKIASDLCRQSHWPIIEELRLETVEQIELDTVWCATQFRLPAPVIKKTAAKLKVREEELEFA